MFSCEHLPWLLLKHQALDVEPNQDFEKSCWLEDLLTTASGFYNLYVLSGISTVTEQIWLGTYHGLKVGPSAFKKKKLFASMIALQKL